MTETNPWQKRFERERKARKAAEALLENKSLELWKNNQNLESIVTERTHSLQEALEIAKEASKAKSAFLANMSHEVRTPLNAILGFASLLKKANLEGKEKKHIEIINASANSLLNVINDILDFSKIESGKIELDENSFVVEETVNVVYHLFTAKAKEKKLKYKVKVDRSIPKCLIGDHHRLHQVLSNLIANAIKFSNPQGIVKVVVELLTNDNSVATVRFRVEDNGVGIPKNKHHEIFSAFSQADSSVTRKFGGTGLGLSISSQLVEMMGSEIHLESDTEQGASFWFDLDMAICSFIKVDHKKFTPDLMPKTFAYARILIAEDTLFNQELIRALLEERQITQIDMANDGIEALEYFHQNSYHLVLMDINMPNLDGVSATEEIRKIESLSSDHPHTPVIALTANAMKGDKERFLEAGMDDYLVKPIEIEELDIILSGYLQTLDRVATETTPEPSVGKKYRIDEVSKALDLSVERLQPIILGYLASVATELKQLSEAIQQNDGEKLYMYAHRIKGSAGNFRMEQAAKLASDIEAIAFSGQSEVLRVLLAQLEQALSDVEEDLSGAMISQ